jgi:LuxR family transcriptional regulator, maltose regulon positive regulatory protein
VERAEASEFEGDLPGGSGSIAAAVETARAGVLSFRGDVEGARQAAERALEREPQGGAAWTTPLSVLGAMLLRLGRFEEGQAAIERSLEVGGSGDVLMTELVNHAFLSLARLHTGGPEAALEAAEEGLAIAAARRAPEGWPIGMLALARGRALQQLGRAGEAEPEAERARRLVGRGFGPHVRAEALLVSGLVRRDLGDAAGARAAFAEALSELRAAPVAGVLLSEAEAAAASLAPVPPCPRATSTARRAPEELSPRERDVLRLLAAPLSLREIAGELFVSHNTVKTHAKAVYRKLGVSSREAAVAAARELGLI